MKLTELLVCLSTAGIPSVKNAPQSSIEITALFVQNAIS